MNEIVGFVGIMMMLGGIVGGWLHLVTRFRKRMTVTSDEKLALTAVDQVQVLEARLAAALERIDKLERDR